MSRIEEDLTPVPEGWAVVTASDVCEVNPRKPAADALSAEAPVTFAPMAAVDADLGAIVDGEERPFGEVRPRSYTPFAEGDVLLAKITPCMENGKAAVARGLANGLGFGTTEFHVFRSKGSVLPEYLYHYIRQQMFRDDAQAHMAGAVGQLRVPAGYVKQFELPLPPLAEQERIVTKVEALLARVRSVRQRLAAMPGILKHFRQAVLAHACSGKLTEDWWEASQSASCVVERLRDSGIDWDARDERDIPNEWVLAPAADLFDWSSGKNLPSKKQQPGPHPVYGGNGISGHHSEVIVEFPSLVVGRVGALCGNVFVTEPHAWVTDNAIYAQTVAPCVSVHFAEHVFRNAALNERSGGSGQPFVNQSILNAVGFPLPPLAEQHEIVRRVEALFALADSIEQRVQTATKQAEALTQSILARAFRGELVPTEADLARAEGRDYESADQLLARIREETPTPKPPRKRAKRPTGAGR